MTETEFNYLLELVTPYISKQDNHMRKSISAEHRLVATLRYLATGRNLEDLKFSYAISPQAPGKIIPETCIAIYKTLHKDFIKFPSNSEEWVAVANDFEQLWNFPNCGGSIDGKHVAIARPVGSGSHFYNYKGYYSIVLLGIVDVNLEFILADVGCNGRVSDGGVIEETVFYHRLKEGKLNLPSIQETKYNLNFVFVADDAFSLREDVLKPFPMKKLTHEQRVFNYRLSRARRVVENAFGILATRFRIFHTTISFEPCKVINIVLACVALHNFLRRKCRKNYTPSSILDREDIEMGTLIEGEWRKDPLPDHAYQGLEIKARKPTDLVKASRLQYVNYFTGKGRIAWQDRMVQHVVIE